MRALIQFDCQSVIESEVDKEAEMDASHVCVCVCEIKTLNTLIVATSGVSTVQADLSPVHLQHFIVLSLP